MYSNQKKSVILASKRNTTYLPNSSNIENENPFPISHINGNGNANGNGLSGGTSGVYSGRQN